MPYFSPAELQRGLLPPPLTDLPEDLLLSLSLLLLDPLQPCHAANLSACARALRALLHDDLLELQQPHHNARALAAHFGMRAAGLSEAWKLNLLTAHDPLSLEHWRTLGDLARRSALPELQTLSVWGSVCGEGVGMLAAGLCHGCLPSLRSLVLADAHVLDEGAVALAAALRQQCVPSLRILSLGNNRLTDAGLSALTATVGRLPRLTHLYLHENRIGAAGLSHMLREPAFPSLRILHLHDNQITDTGCAGLAAALRRGALPALGELHLGGNPASASAQAAVLQALEVRIGGCERRSSG